MLMFGSKSETQSTFYDAVNTLADAELLNELARVCPITDIRIERLFSKIRNFFL